MFFGKKRPDIWVVIAAIATSAIAATPLDPGEQGNEFEFTPIDVPGALRTSAQGINDAGDVSGYFVDTRGTHGFLLRRGDLTIIDYPGAVWTHAFGINPQGDMRGDLRRPRRTGSILCRDCRYARIPSVQKWTVQRNPLSGPPV